MELKVLKEVKDPIFYVTNDVSWGIGLESILPNYHIVCLDDHPLVDLLVKSKISVFCLERILGKKNLLMRSSGNVLESEKVLEFIKGKSGRQKPKVLFFKPSRKIETIAKQEGLDLVGNTEEINNCFENKVHFFKNYHDQLPLPPGEIVSLYQANFAELSLKYGLPLVIQFGIGWAGKSTYFVSSEMEFEEIRLRCKKNRVKIGKFIEGSTVLNNAVVLPRVTLFSYPAIQIKAEGILTQTQGGTGGRQWPVRLEKEQLKQIANITFKMGSLLRETGYKGFFGLDFLIEGQSGKVYLSECNARLTASVPFYTKLQLLGNDFPLLGYHLLAFLSAKLVKGENFAEPLPTFGSEIVARNTKSSKIKIIKSIKPGIYNDDLRFVRDSFYLEEDPSLGKIWLTAAAEGRIVNPEIEILRINTKEEVCLDNGELNKKYRKVVDDALSCIETENVE